MSTSRLPALFLLIGLLLIPGCSSHISTYSQTAYEQAISLKVDSLQQIDEATEPYSNHAADVNLLMTRIEKAYEYAKGRPKKTKYQPSNGKYSKVQTEICSAGS